MSVLNYRNSPHNDQEERSAHRLRGGSPKSRPDTHVITFKNNYFLRTSTCNCVETLQRIFSVFSPLILIYRPQWSRCLRHGSAVDAGLMGMRFRIPPLTWKSPVSVACCQVEDSTTVRSLVQRGPTECDESGCDRGTSQRRPRLNKVSRAMVKKCLIYLISITKYGYVRFVYILFFLCQLVISIMVDGILLLTLR